MSPNSSAVFNRPRTLMDSSLSDFCALGSAPSWPAETWMFCSRMAAITSPAVSWRAATLCGSSQTRIA